MLAHQGLEDKAIRAIEKIGRTTPLDIRKRYHAGGLARAIYDAPRSGHPRILSSGDEAQIIAIACSDPPDGRECWTIGLITKELGRRCDKKASKSTIARILMASNLKPWREKNVVCG